MTEPGLTPRDGRVIAQEISATRDQIAALMPHHENVVKILVAMFAASGGEAQAHNKGKPADEHIKPTQRTTMEEMLKRLRKQNQDGMDKASQVTLPEVQDWMRAFKELMANENTKPLMLKMANLYHEQAKAPPLTEESLILTVDALFLFTLKNHFGFSF